MTRMLTVVMYHYVRDLARSRFPNIKGLETSLFEEQLAYFARFYTFVTPAECLDAVVEGGDLPPNPLLLTFDDGISDHYLNVVPLMREARIRGVFFVNAKPLAEDCVMDVHKIHFLLASCPDAAALLQEIRAWLFEHETTRDLASPIGEKKIVNETRYDSDDVSAVKKLLQRDLPDAVRKELCRELFARHVTADEAAFSAELYMNRAQVREMASDGFVIGSHGYDHVWLNSLGPQEQAREVSMSISTFGNILGGPGRWMFSYPYGAYNADTKKALKALGCGLAFAAAPGFAALEETRRFELLRFDTNDFPKDRSAVENDLTRQALVTGSRAGLRP